MTNVKWAGRFIDLAKHVAGWSKDPSTQVGAVIVTMDNRIISVGYNGFPSAIADDKRLHNRELKNRMVVHAEVNALLHDPQLLKPWAIYTWPFAPCSRCAALIITRKIPIVYYRNEISAESLARWADDIKLALDMFAEAGISYKEI